MMYAVYSSSRPHHRDRTQTLRAHGHLSRRLHAPGVTAENAANGEKEGGHRSSTGSAHARKNAKRRPRRVGSIMVPTMIGSPRLFQRWSSRTTPISSKILRAIA